MLSNEIERNRLPLERDRIVLAAEPCGGLRLSGFWTTGCLLLLLIVCNSGCKSAFRSNDASLGAGFYDQDGHYIGHWGGKAKGEFLGSSAPVMPHPPATPQPHGHGAHPSANTPHPSPMPPGQAPAGDNSGVARISQ